GRLLAVGILDTAYSRLLPAGRPFILRVRSRMPFNSSMAIPRPVSVAFRSESLADDVVGVFAKPLFFLSGGFQFAANALRTMATPLSLGRRTLKSLTAGVVTPACLLYAFAAEGFARAVNGEIDYAKVHANEIRGGSRRPVRQVHRHEQKPFTAFAA